MSARDQIISRHFSPYTLRALRQRGVRVLGTTFIPDSCGDFTRGETAYSVDDNGTGRVLRFGEVIAMAAA